MLARSVLAAALIGTVVGQLPLVSFLTTHALYDC